MTRRLLLAEPRRPLPTETPAAVLAEHDVPQPVLAKDRSDLGRDEHLERLFAIVEQIEAGMATLAERLQSAIPSWILEYGYLPSAKVLSSSPAYGGAVSTLSARTTDLEYVTTIVASVPSGATGLVQLGDVVIPVSPGTTTMPDVRIPLFPADLRMLSVTTAGPIALVLCGQVAPVRGKLPL